MEFGQRLRQERLRRGLSQEALAEALEISPRSVLRWEQGQAVPQASLRLQLGRFLELSPALLFAEHQREVPSSTLWYVPYPRNLFFTGREQLLEHLYRQLHREHNTALTQSWAINGLGGIGKTQIALEYVYRYRQEYTAIFWTSAATRETLLSDLVAIADLLQLPECSERDQTVVIQAVKRWFVLHEKWLWVLDNADDIEMVEEIVPVERSGHLLLTSRAQALGSLAQRIEVETMGMVEGTLFLLRRAKLLTPDRFLDQVPEGILASAEAIVLEMDFLPLALDQAGAYIEEVGCSLSAYLELYQTYRKELLQRRGRLVTDHPDPVATTWALSFQKITQENAAAAQLLQLCAFLEPDTIPEELISQGDIQLQSSLMSPTMNALQLNEAIEALRRFSMIQRSPETRTLRIHRLVQAVLKDAMGRDVQQQWAAIAVQATSHIFPATVDIATWPECQRYLAQAQACSALIQEYQLLSDEAASLLSRSAQYLQDYGLYEQAEPLYRQAVRIREQITTDDASPLAATYDGLAELCRELGKNAEAEAFFQHALHCYEQARGPVHPDLGRPLVGLARLSYRRNAFEQAESQFQRALSLYEQGLSATHPNLVHPLIGLARLYYRQGKYGEAESLYQRALQICERTRGSNHPEVASVLNGLANVYKRPGTYAQAEPLYRRALQIRQQALGPEHPEIASVLNNLAALFEEQNKYEQAEPLYQQALHIWERALGSDHLNIGMGLNNLALLLEKQGKYEQAEELYQRSLDIYTRAVGSEHSEVAAVLNGLANVYRAQRRYAEAEPLYQRALQLRLRVLGREHPDTAETLHDLALLEQLQSQTESETHPG